MTEVPTTEWSADFRDDDALDGAPRFSARTKPAVAWRRVPGIVRHVFTHFPLELSVWRATLAAKTPAPKGMRWIALSAIGGEAFPSLMRKVVAFAIDPKDD